MNRLKSLKINSFAVLALSLTIVQAAFFLSACYPPKISQSALDIARSTGYDDGYRDASSAYIDSMRAAAQEVAELRRDLKIKNERLRKFNQLDEKGNLRGETPRYRSPPTGNQAAPIMGTEGWQK